MEYRPFGKTGMKVSAIGFGCWEMGGSYGHIHEEKVISAIHRALDLGINLFDTAEVYGFGKSEALLARGLGEKRKDVILVSKFGTGYVDSGRERHRDGRRERAMASIENSLKILKTDYVDVYLVHWPDPQTTFDETMKAMEEIVQQGKARFVGVSNFKQSEIAECMATRNVDVGQYGYHLFDRRIESEVLPYCEEHGMGVMAYGPLAHGLLTGTFDKNTTFDEEDWRSKGGLFNMPLFTEENFPRNLRVVEELKDIARRNGKEMYHLALGWVLSNPAVSVALVGAREPAEVEANMGALDWVLNDEVKKSIEKIFDEHGVDTKPDLWVE
jgi:aryl-alcohol dehydrogenase-like predicted oxidoreductase